MPGIVIFDPVVLDGFLKKRDIQETNIFYAFLNDEKLGWAAIDEGVVIPIYQISEQDYSVFLIDDSEASSSLPKAKFYYSGFNIKIESGLVIVSDLNALMDWDKEFFLSYRENYTSRMPSNDFLEIPTGLYELELRGYKGLKTSTSGLGYGLKVNSVKKFNSLNKSISIDDLDFEL
ncbi:MULTISPECIES: hypothetical protein [Pseudomonas]|nr:MULTISPECIES: hypothetical protein [Pseudomonas]